jgi:hypothetical protein
MKLFNYLCAISGFVFVAMASPVTEMAKSVSDLQAETVSDIHNATSMGLAARNKVGRSLHQDICSC